jgi:hypothetical protein
LHGYSLPNGPVVHFRNDSRSHSMGMGNK